MKVSNQEILYDSNDKKFKFTRGSFQKTLYGKKNVVVVVQTEQGSIIGSYHSAIPNRPDDDDMVAHWIIQFGNVL